MTSEVLLILAAILLIAACVVSGVAALRRAAGVVSRRHIADRGATTMSESFDDMFDNAMFRGSRSAQKLRRAPVSMPASQTATRRVVDHVPSKLTEGGSNAQTSQYHARRPEVTAEKMALHASNGRIVDARMFRD